MRLFPRLGVIGERPRIALVAGNGLVLDLLRAGPDDLRRWNTQHPLGWEINLSDDPRRSLLDEFPTLRDSLAHLAELHPHAGDFEILKHLLRIDHEELKRITGNPAVPDPGSSLHEEVRHYLTICFSAFQTRVRELFQSAWRWIDWLGEHKQSLTMAVSFNYDLVLEDALTSIGLAPRRIGVLGDRGTFAVFKPHGSIDFAPDLSMIGVPFPPPHGVRVLHCIGPQRVLPQTSILMPRAEAAIVLPGETSGIRDYPWVAQGYDRFLSLARTWTHVVFVGSSYWTEDRPEIDLLVAGLASTTRVANPHPPDDFLSLLRNRKISHDIWESELKALR